MNIDKYHANRSERQSNTLKKKKKHRYDGGRMLFVHGLCVEAVS